MFPAVEHRHEIGALKGPAEAPRTVSPKKRAEGVLQDVDDMIPLKVAVDHYNVLSLRDSRDLQAENMTVAGGIVPKRVVNALIAEGDLRLERHAGTGTLGLPKKLGKGGKYTWEGQYHLNEQEICPAAIDQRDPNFDDPVTESDLEADKIRTRMPSLSDLMAEE